MSKNYNEIYQKSCLDISNSHSYNNIEKNQNSSIDNVDSRKVLEPLEVLGNSDAKDSRVIQENTEEVNVPNYIYRIGRTDN
jgi:hypothetical protein